MPITVITSEGVLDAAAERTILPRLTKSLLARLAVDGSWGIADRAWTNAELAEAVGSSASR